MPSRIAQLSSSNKWTEIWIKKNGGLTAIMFTDIVGFTDITASEKGFLSAGHVKLGVE